MSSNDDDGDFEYEDEQKYIPGMDAFDRVGPGGNLFPGGPMHPIDRAMQDPLERFQIQVDAISRNLNNWDGIDISEQMITKMVETARMLNVVKHKNAASYVLGFLASHGGGKIDKKGVDFVIAKVLPHVQEEHVLPPDVIRYARLWVALD